MANTHTPDPSLGHIVDDKLQHCIPFLLARLEAYRTAESAADGKRPFIVGINGVQGVGKSTLVNTLYNTLQDRHGLETLVVSIDDFYLPHAEQRALAAAHPTNALVQVRGEPGTHDTALLASVIEALIRGEPVHIPSYDKAAFSGAGDRMAPTTANPGCLVNGPGQRRVAVVVVEGWCVGFRALAEAAVRDKWEAERLQRAQRQEELEGDIADDDDSFSTLANHALEDLLFVNAQLSAYDAALTRHLDAFIHLDALHTRYVYAWRREQEAALRRDRGAVNGMTDEQVNRFVDAYYPAYELFADGVRQGVFAGLQADGGADMSGRQLRLVVGRDRRVQKSIII